MRYKVPQNIDMQDRILGPLTLIQLVYALVGAGAAYSIIVTAPPAVRYFLAAPVAIFTIALSFIKVNERPFINFFLSAIRYFSSPKTRIWHHQSVDNFKVVIYKANKKEHVIPAKKFTHEQIHDAAKQLDKA